MSKAEYLAKHLDTLITEGGQPVHLVKFHHDSPGLRKLRLDIAKAILRVLDRYEPEDDD